jgi:hypothetical protein
MAEVDGNRKEKLSREWADELSKKLKIPSEVPPSKPKEWWRKELESHLSEGKDVKHFLLRSFFERYLADFWGVQTAPELNNVFKKDPERFQGSDEEEKKLFDDFIIENFESWLKDNNIAIGKKTQVEKKKEPRVDKNLYQLSINKLQMERYISPPDRKLAEEFIRLWKSGNVVRIGLGIREDEVASIALAAEEGGLEKKVYLSAIVFRKVFDGMKPFKNDKGNAVGFVFESESGRSNYIFSKTPPEIAEEIFSRVAIEGKRLKSGFSVKFVPMKKK